MTGRRLALLGMLAALLALAGCGAIPQLPGPVPTQPPGSINTIVALTSGAADALTQKAAPTPTGTQLPTGTATKTPTSVPTSTATFYFRLPDTETPVPTKRLPPIGPGGSGSTTTPYPVSEWPEWSTGTVVDMPKGSGEGIGTTRFFDILINVKMEVVRSNGVKLREIPSLTVGDEKVKVGTYLYQTGYWNKNSMWDWEFIKVQAPDGKLWWVGDREGEESDPKIALEFVTWYGGYIPVKPERVYSGRVNSFDKLLISLAAGIFR